MPRRRFARRNAQDLLPTLRGFQRKNKNVVVKWFARGRLWDSPDAERASQTVPRPTEKRNQDWRPGGQHKDPRARFDKEAQRRKKREQHAQRNAGPAREGNADRPRNFNPRAPKAPWTPKFHAPRPRPSGPRPDRGASGGDRKPWSANPPEGRPGGGGNSRPWKRSRMARGRLVPATGSHGRPDRAVRRSADRGRRTRALTRNGGRGKTKTRLRRRATALGEQTPWRRRAEAMADQTSRGRPEALAARRARKRSARRAAVARQAAKPLTSALARAAEQAQA